MLDKVLFGAFFAGFLLLVIGAYAFLGDTLLPIILIISFLILVCTFRRPEASHSFRDDLEDG